MKESNDQICAVIEKIREHTERAFEREVEYAIEKYESQYGRKEPEIVEGILRSYFGNPIEFPWGIVKIEKELSKWVVIPYLWEGEFSLFDFKLGSGIPTGKEYADFPIEEIEKRIPNNYKLVQIDTRLKDMTMELETEYQKMEPEEFPIVRNKDLEVSMKVRKVTIQINPRAIILGPDFIVRYKGEILQNYDKSEIMEKYLGKYNRAVLEISKKYEKPMEELAKKVEEELGSLYRVHQVTWNLKDGEVLVSVLVNYNDLCKNSNAT